MTRDLALPFAASAVIAGLVGALTLIDAVRPKPENEMRTVEQLLVDHGLPVDGFAATPPVNLEAIDAMAPAECAEILRKEYLTRLAVIRMAPTHADEAGKIAHAVRFTLARDAGTPECAR